MENEILNSIIENYPDEDILKVDGFDDAVIGIELNTMKLVYDVSKMIDILISPDMDYLEAVEYLEFNTFCAYVGEKTPIFVTTNL